MGLSIYLIKNYPACTCCGREAVREHLHEQNITHNLNRMAQAAGFYSQLWRPDENGIKTAGELAPFLEAGLAAMKEEPDKFKALNPSNGWGSYDGFIPWLEEILAACKQHPDAEIEVWG